MSFTEKDFIKLNQENRIKKLIFTIRESLLTNNNNNLQNILEWFKKYENEDLSEYENDYSALLNTLIEKLKKINPFIEDTPFDNNNNSTKFKIIVILDNIRSPFNVGSILRSAECFGVEEVIMCGITPSPELNNKVKKTMMNSPVKYSYNFDIIDTIKKLKEKKYTIVALEKTNNSLPLFKLNILLPIALICGNEEFGISKEVLELSDTITHIPIFGYKNSLNVSVATGIALNYIVYNIC